MILAVVLLLVGFVLLVKGADIFVDGSSGIARKLKIPSIVIGLTIVAMGTSAPEAAVSIIAGVNGSNDIAVGNVIGSNIFNILLILGLSSTISNIVLDGAALVDLSVMLGSGVAIMLIALCFKKMGRWQGALFVLSYAGYLAYIIIRN